MIGALLHGSDVVLVVVPMARCFAAAVENAIAVGLMVQQRHRKDVAAPPFVG